MEPTKIPVIKPEAMVTIELNSQEISAIVQAIFYISEGWTKDNVDEIITTLQAQKPLTDPRQITFVLLDRVYKKLLKEAQDTNQTAETELTIPSPVTP